MLKQLLLLLFVTLSLFGSIDYTQKNNCLNCHKGIEHIRQENSGMSKAIAEVAAKAGYAKNSCIVCHGGNPATRHKNKAHKGTVEYFQKNPGPKDYYPAPASAWINENTCGICHPVQVKNQRNSLMMSAEGTIHGALWRFGAKEGYQHVNGNYKTHNPRDPMSRSGTKIYNEYMAELTKKEPQAFTQALQELPKAPTLKEVTEDPSLALYTYLRQECLSCHTGSKGSAEYGSFRGLGCASCHIPYSNEGVYEGGDKSISKKEPGHLLSHQIQSSRKVKVTIHDVNYSGVPVKSCATCHSGGKRIGLSYQGLLNSELSVESNRKSSGHYLHMKEDVHFQKGMLCQDCHTSNDLHGDGFLRGANFGAVEIECQDCHGTTKNYPWELPLAYGDEFNITAATGEPRGVTQTVAKYLKQGFIPEKKEDGYILSARGNPLPKALKKGNKVVLYLASGKEIELKPLKLLKEEKSLSKKALTAMDVIDAHTQKLECYTCHATWAPQYYGLNVTIDYSHAQSAVDYVQAANAKDKHGTTGEMRELKAFLIPGKVTQNYSYLRWEDPALGQNGEGRITPLVPEYQSVVSVLGENAKVLLHKHLFQVKNQALKKEEQHNALVMAPVQPHTIQKESRSCESCHTSAKALGLGVGSLVSDPSQGMVIDLMSAEKELLPQHTNSKIEAVENLRHDYSQFLDKNGKQLMSVGEHFRLSAPLNDVQRSKLDRRGVCMSCHKSIPEGNLAVSAMTHIAEMVELDIDNREHQGIVHKILNLGAWIQIVGIGLIIFLVIYIIYTVYVKKRSINPRNRGWK